MRRIDAHQAHRPGVLALLRALPAEPPIALMLALATRRSMRWMLQAAGVLPTSGVRGELRVKGLVAVWLWTIRAWRSDESRGSVGDDVGAGCGAAPCRKRSRMARLASAAGGTRRRHLRHRGPHAGRAGLSVVALPPIKGVQPEVR